MDRAAAAHGGSPAAAMGQVPGTPANTVRGVLATSALSPGLSPPPHSGGLPTSHLRARLGSACGVRVLQTAAGAGAGGVNGTVRVPRETPAPQQLPSGQGGSPMQFSPPSASPDSNHSPVRLHPGARVQRNIQKRRRQQQANLGTSFAHVLSRESLTQEELFTHTQAELKVGLSHDGIAQARAARVRGVR